MQDVGMNLQLKNKYLLIILRVWKRFSVCFDRYGIWTLHITRLILSQPGQLQIFSFYQWEFVSFLF